MSIEPIKVASIGLGRWAGVIAEGIKEVPDLKLCGCFTRPKERRSAFAKEFGCREYPDYEAVLSDDEIDAVVITTPHSVHGEQVLAAAAANKHVFVEKPLTLSMDDAEHVIRACKEAKVTLMVGHCWRKLGPVEGLKKLLEEGKLGKIVQASGHFGNPRALNLSKEIWRDSPEESPGGPLTGPGFHLLDVLVHFLGPVKRVNAVFEKQLNEGHTVDTALATLQFASGSFAHVSTSFISAKCYELALFGSEGSAFICLDPSGSSQNPNSLRYQRLHETTPIHIQVHNENMIELQMTEFAQCIRYGETPLTGGEQGAELVALLLSITDSAEKQQWVSPGRSQGKAS